MKTKRIVGKAKIPVRKLPHWSEWDFRFVKRSELEVIAVYEYARSCPWVRWHWEDWLRGPEPVLNSSGVDCDDWTKPFRDVLVKRFKSKVPIWDEGTAEAKYFMARFSQVLLKANLKYLFCSVPAFPLRWTQLPSEQKTAALRLLPGALPLFRDAAKPNWASDMTFTVEVDLAEDIKKIRKDADRWLVVKKDEYDSARRRSGKPPEDPRQQWKTANPGGAAKACWVALSQLGAYRLHQAGYDDFNDAVKVMNDRITEQKNPKGNQYPQLYTAEMDQAHWDRWYSETEQRMVGMFKLRTSQIYKIPGLRWKPEQ